MNRNHRSGVSAAGAVDVFQLASFCEVSLNNKPARIDLAPNSGLIRVTAKDGSDRACFNWSAAETVMSRRKGQFVTKDRQELMPTFINPLAAARAILGVA